VSDLVQAESKRVRDFRTNLFRTIPRAPNNSATLKKLESMPLSTLLLHYSNWVCRYVRPRPRTVSIEPQVTNDPRWKQLGGEINALLAKVRRGDDLTPHLSLAVHKRGYSGKDVVESSDRWEDKDFLLNVMGYHHFHLSSTTEDAGFNKRTDDVLFAMVTRDAFAAIGIFDHSVFESPDEKNPTLNAERDRLWQIYDTRGRPPMQRDAVYIQTMITTSGHADWQVRLAQQYAHLIRLYDAKLDDASYVAQLFRLDGSNPISRMKLRWRLDFLDLCILEEKNLRKVVLMKGPV
jgi:hypothetical protein